MPNRGRPRTRIDVSVEEVPESSQFANVQETLLAALPLLAQAIQHSPANGNGESAVPPPDGKPLDSPPPIATRNKRNKSR